MNRFYMIFIFLFFAMFMAAQELPVDPGLKTGKLDNGVTYYIYNNSYSKDKAEMYIAFKVGAILEESEENGMAHFIEHMAFSGGEKFSKKRLHDFLSLSGMEKNAFTNHLQTVYHINNIPLSEDNVLDSCLLIAHDWSSALSFNEADIENEKKIISEELRFIYTSDFMVGDKLMKSLIPDSKYSSHNVIGKEDAFNAFTSDMLRKFYNKWYRPDMQAIIIVGDIDTDSVEEKIKNIFGDIPLADGNCEIPVYEVFDKKKSLIKVVKDKEFIYTHLCMDFRNEPLSAAENGTVDAFVVHFLNDVTKYIINERFEGVIKDASGQKNNIEVNYGEFMSADSDEAFSFILNIGNDNIEESAKLLMSEISRIRKHGFTDAEYARAKQSLNTIYKERLDEKDNTENIIYVEQYLEHFYKGKYIPGIEIEYDILCQVAPQLSIEHLNEYVRELLPEENIVIYLIAPENVETPEEKLISEWYAECNDMEQEPYTDKFADEPLLSEIPEAGKIIREYFDEDTDATVFELSNGARAIFRKTDFKKNQILFSAISPGGGSVYPEDYIVNSKIYKDIFDLGGAGPFNRSDLMKKLAGKNIEMTGIYNPLCDGLKVSSTPEYMEDFLQLVYLQFTSPNLDRETFDAYIKRKRMILGSSNINFVFQNSFLDILYKDKVRMTPLKADDLDKADYDQIIEWRNKRFSDAGDYTFVFVGNADPDSCRSLVEIYLASLPSSPSSVKSKFNHNADIGFRDGIVKASFNHKSEVEKCLISSIYSTTVDYNLKNKIILETFVEIMDKMLTNTIREKEGGVYSITTEGDIFDYPEGQIFLNIVYSTETGKEKYLNSKIKEVLEEFISVGANEDAFKNAVETICINHDNNMKDNSFIFSTLNRNYALGTNDIKGYTEILNSITGEDVRQMAIKLLNENYVEVIMRGEREQ